MGLQTSWPGYSCYRTTASWTTWDPGVLYYPSAGGGVLTPPSLLRKAGLEGSQAAPWKQGVSLLT